MQTSCKLFEISGAIVFIKGDVDLYSSPDLWNVLSELLQSGKNKIILDLSQVKYMDSSGVGVLINLVQSIKKIEGQLLVSGLHGMPLQVLKMSNIISLLSLCESPENGIAHFSDQN